MNEEEIGGVFIIERDELATFSHQLATDVIASHSTRWSMKSSSQLKIRVHESQ